MSSSSSEDEESPGGEHQECPICLEELAHSNKVNLPCDHAFHISCIVELRKKKDPTCPLCRAPLPLCDIDIKDLNEKASHIFITVSQKVSEGESSWRELSDSDSREMVEAIRYWLEGAKSFDIGSCHNLGYVFEHGYGTEVDLQAAHHHYLIAAEQGHPKSQCNLGLLYLAGGEGIQQSYPEALKWLRAAADQDDAQACYNLGILYDEGKGLEKNFKDAYHWIEKAAGSNLANAKYYEAEMLESGRGVRRNLRKAIKLYVEAAELKCAQAMYNIGRLYEDGEGVDQDSAEAFRWYMLAAEQKHEEALYFVAVAYEHGECGVEPNPAEAAKYYRLAALQGNVQAHFNLGILYCQGEGVAQSYVEARELFQFAAMQGYDCAIKSLKHNDFVAAVESEINRSKTAD